MLGKEIDDNRVKYIKNNFRLKIEKGRQSKL